MMRAFIRSVGSVGKRFNQRFARARRARSVGWGMAVLAAALLIPAAAFAFTGQTGSAAPSYTGALAVNVAGTTLFTAPTTVTCMVTVDLTTSTQSVTFSPTGNQVLWPLGKINGGNQFSGQGVYVSSTVQGGIYTSHNTTLFTLNPGDTAQFGCHISAGGTFANSGVFGTCNTTYVCQ